MGSSSLSIRHSLLVSMLGILCITCFPATAQTAKKTEADTDKKEDTDRQPPEESNREQFDFSSTGRPGNQTAGENRGNCPAVDRSLTAMLPDSNFGKTTATHPSFWFYMPYLAADVESVEFVLQDEQHEDIWRSQVDFHQAPGYINISLPSSVDPLKIGLSYQWYVKVACDSKFAPPIYVRGWIERTNVAYLKNYTPQNNHKRSHLIYARNGIWYDAVDKILSLDTKDCHLLQKDWETLLNAKGVNLELPQPKFSVEIVRDTTNY